MKSRTSDLQIPRSNALPLKAQRLYGGQGPLQMKLKSFFGWQSYTLFLWP